MKQKIIALSLFLLVGAVGISIISYALEGNTFLDQPSHLDQSPSSLPTELKSGKNVKQASKYQRPQIYLIAGGDIMLSRNIGSYNKKEGYDRIFGSGNFHPIAQFPECTSKNCVLFFNLESLFHPKDNDIPLGGFTFRANTNNIAVLQQLRKPPTQQVAPYSQGIPLTLSLANNHTVNGGYEGIITTQDVLHGGGDISHVGAGTTTEEAHEIAQYTFGFSICFQAYSYDGKENLKVGGGRMSRNSLNEEQLLADLAMMQDRGCLVKILSLHRGNEYKLHPNQRQRTLAHTLIDNGADLILGGHSHVPGEIEYYKGKYIFYSLGNFIFDQGRGKTSKDVAFDHIFDHTLQRQTVPTYIAMLAGLKIVQHPQGVYILLDKIHMSTTTDGKHQPLDEQTRDEILENILLFEQKNVSSNN